MSKTITKVQQRRNRLKLAKYLETKVSDRAFNMEMFMHRDKSCGTVGCALGHAVHGGLCKGYEIDIEKDAEGGVYVRAMNSKTGKFADFHAIGNKFFGKKTTSTIFVGTPAYPDDEDMRKLMTRRVIAAMLRDIKD